MIKSYFNEDIEEIVVKFTMPAIQDFLFEFIIKNSEQYIPLILQSCAFFNQLQILLEYVAEKCSDKITNMITQECIIHYHDYPFSYMEYNEGWHSDLALDIISYDELSKFYHVLRCCNPLNHPELFDFLEVKIKEYCQTMGGGDLVAQYTDLHNLPSIIVSCIEKGMVFNGDEIITKFADNAFSVNHYIEMEKFNKVFPKDFSNFYEIEFKGIKGKLRDIILDEIEFLIVYGMDIELDILIDRVPEILHEFNLRYTQKFGDKIYFLTGRRPQIISKHHRSSQYDSKYVDDDEEIEVNVIKKEAEKWLFGPVETYLEETEMLTIILESQLGFSKKTSLIQNIKLDKSTYLDEWMNTKESIDILLGAIQELEDEIPNNESKIAVLVLYYLTENDLELLKELIKFCAEAFMLFMHQEEPIIRWTEFYTSEVYEEYLKKNEVLRGLVLEKLILGDGEWVRFVQLPIFIFCNAFIIVMGKQDKKLVELYNRIFGDNIFKIKLKTKVEKKCQNKILYMDFGPYYFKRFDWEGMMYRAYQELAPFHFNQNFVAPKIKHFLDLLGNGHIDKKILNYISHCEYQFEYTTFGNAESVTSKIGDELSMMYHLGIFGELDVYPPDVPMSLLKRLNKNGEICNKVDRTWRINVSKIKDIGLLREIGVYEQVYNLIEQIESIHNRFLKGDFFITKL